MIAWLYRLINSCCLITNDGCWAFIQQQKCLYIPSTVGNNGVQIFINLMCQGSPMSNIKTNRNNVHTNRVGLKLTD